MPLCRNDGSDKRQEALSVDTQTGDGEPLEEEQDWFRCARCSFQIAPADSRCAVQGKHQHTAVNPDGALFHFLTFSKAPGCSPAGPVSSYFSWFPGCTWQVLICGGCGTHLGWRFQSAAESFYGLISDRLREGSS